MYSSMTSRSILATIVLCLSNGIADSESPPSPPTPVVRETPCPAARSRIGKRGNYTAGLTQLPDGTLLACLHRGSTELQRVYVWRSTDQGQSWSQIATQGDALFGRGASLLCLSDGSLLLHTGALYRSVDQGITWNQVECPETGNVRNLVEIASGEVLLFGTDDNWYTGWEPDPSGTSDPRQAWYRETSRGALAKRRAWLARSSDGGRTWSQPKTIIDKTQTIDDKTNWSELQPYFKESSIVTLSKSHLLATSYRNGATPHTVLLESLDQGQHWSERDLALPPSSFHAHLTRLQGGVLLCTYVTQDIPRGIFAVISRDQGQTWDLGRPFYLAPTMPNPFGWPTSLQLPDGSIVTSYTIKGYEESTQIHDSVTEVVRWKLPDRTTPAIQPVKQPLFAEAHDFRMYMMGITGFTGGDLQQISSWEHIACERSQIPGYKGAMARFPDGEILVTPFQDELTKIFRSRDEGRSWEKLDMKGDPIPGKEQSMICLRDGKTVLLKTEAKGSPLFRSTDRGLTWQRIAYGEPTGTTRNFLQLSDGSVVMFGFTGTEEPTPESPCTTAWRLRSFDGGLTWPERKEIETWNNPAPFLCEVNVLAFSDTNFLAATRVNGPLARKIAGAPPIEIGEGGGLETDECMVLMNSTDGGLHWSNFRTFLGYSDVHVHLLQLSDGRLLCVYRRRFLPFGVAAVVSDDQGQTWDLDHPLLIGTRPTCYGGWPSSLELADGSILTNRAWMRWPDSIFEVTRWRLDERNLKSKAE